MHASINICTHTLHTVRQRLTRYLHGAVGGKAAWGFERGVKREKRWDWGSPAEVLMHLHCSSQWGSIGAQYNEQLTLNLTGTEAKIWERHFTEVKKKGEKHLFHTTFVCIWPKSKEQGGCSPLYWSHHYSVCHHFSACSSQTEKASRRSKHTQKQRVKARK